MFDIINMPIKDFFTRKKNPSSPAGPSSGWGGGKAAGNPVETMFETYKEEADDDKIGPEVLALAIGGCASRALGLGFRG